MPLLKQLIFLAVAIVTGFPVSAQKDIERRFTSWISSNNRIALGKRFTLQLDATLRSTGQLRHIQTVLIWPGLIYHINKYLNIAAGYCLLDARQEIDEYSSYTRENQLWEQLIISHPLGIGKGLNKRIGSLLHRMRYEQRFVPGTVLRGSSVQADGTGFSTRFRYQVRGMAPLHSTPNGFERGPYLSLQDEIMLNVSGQHYVNGKVFDQNRSYAGAGFRFSKKVDIELGYIYRFLDDGGNSYIHDNVMQFTTFLRL